MIISHLYQTQIPDFSGTDVKSFSFFLFSQVLAACAGK